MSAFSSNAEISDNTFDAIVIGSGLGGLTAAAILAKFNKKRVLVLEKHFQLGGLTHEFQRGNFSWDVGLHYVGEMETENLARQLFDFITGGALDWQKMPYIFEKFVYPDLVFEVPSDPHDYQRRLELLFPQERSALRRYFHDIHGIAAWSRSEIVEKVLPPPLSILVRLSNLTKRKTALRTVGNYLGKHFKSSRLKALLASQWGDYGVPPKEASFAIHALIVDHYLHGAYFPVGGASSIAKAIRPVIEGEGGAILLGHRVDSLITRDETAIGLNATYEDGPGEKKVSYFAPLIISDIGAVETYERLLNQHASRIPGFEHPAAKKGLSTVTAYLGMSRSPESLGVHGENFWVYGSYDHDNVESNSAALLGGAPAFCYISFPSLKTPHPRSHTAQIIAFVDYDSFQRFKNKPWFGRSPDYYDAKEKITKGLIELADRTIPGLAGLVTYSELSTPLSMENFTSRVAGLMYGVPATPERYRMPWLKVSTPLKGFLLTGTDVTFDGVVGALMSGVVTAATLNGPFGFFKIVNAAKKPSKASPIRASDARAGYGHVVSNERSVRLVSANHLSSHFQELVFESPQAVPFVPGQHVYLEVAQGEWRPYSIASSKDNRLTFIIDSNPGGPGSRLATAATIGTVINLRAPTGTLRVHDSLCKNRVFVATGSGITPFLAMLKNMEPASGTDRPTTLLWGIREEDDDFSSRYLGHSSERTNLTVIPCVSSPMASLRFFRGSVRTKIRELPLDFDATDFYLCGNPSMVAETHTWLRSQGAAATYFEL